MSHMDIETKMKKLYSIIGLPCSGKSTLAKLIATKVFNDECTIISAGDTARELMTTPELKLQTTKADLFPLENLLRSKITEKVESAPNHPILLEGCPRFAGQVDYIIDQFWVYQPTVIQINVGDNITLYNRAKFRGRETDREFDIRLSKAEVNLNSVFKRMNERLLPYHTILSGLEDYMIKEWKRITTK
jgi:adenylate kinase family enzyme